MSCLLCTKLIWILNERNTDERWEVERKEGEDIEEKLLIIFYTVCSPHLDLSVIHNSELKAHYTET